MSRNKKIFISVIVFYFLLITYNFLRTNKTTELSLTTPENNTKLDSIHNLDQEQKPTAKPQESTTFVTAKKSFKNQLASCYKEADNIKSLNDFFNSLEKNNSVKSIQDEVANIHFTDHTGRKLRAQLLYFTDKTEFKLFQVLSDGLPDLITIPKEDSFNPDTTTLSKYINYDKIYWQQKKSTYFFANQDKASIEFINSEPETIALYSKDFSIFCSKQECFCKR